MSNPEINTDTALSFKQGDPKAFDVFFIAWYHHLFYFAMQMIGSRVESEDIAKDSFVKLWNGHAGFDSPQAIKSFLYITTKNACINFLNRKKVRRNFQKEFAYLENTRHEELALNKLIRSEFMQEIYEEIERLPDKRKEVFKLAYFEGMSNQEIADLLKISVYTVKVHKGKAIADLRVRFNDKQVAVFLLLCIQCMNIFGRS